MNNGPRLGKILSPLPKAKEKRNPGHNKSYRWTILRNRSLSLFTVVFAFFLTATLGQVNAQQDIVASPTDASTFVNKAFDIYPVVAIGDLPGCEQLHAFLRSLVPALIQSGSIDEIIVDFGNPRLQPILDRYVLDGEMVPQEILRKVWDNTSRSLMLTWDSPVYEEFFDAVRAANLLLPLGKRTRVVLVDVSIDWSQVHSQDDFNAFTGELREQALARQIDDAILGNKRTLVISMPDHLVRMDGHARNIVDKEHPGKLLTILTQGRFGTVEQYRAIESGEKAWEIPSIIRVNDPIFRSVPLVFKDQAILLSAAADAILYLGPSDSLTRLYPWASIFQNDEFWTELNRRSQILTGQPFNLFLADFDLRGKEDDVVAPIDRSAHRPVSACCGLTVLASHAETHEPPPTPQVESNGKNENGVDFVLAALDQHPMVGLGDDHMGLEFYEFLDLLLSNPRLPGKVNDIVVEFGNPRYQLAIDRYVVEGAEVPRKDREGAWQYAAEGWYVANSPVYEHFFDSVRALNQKLPLEKRIRIVLGDAAIDFQEFIDKPTLLMNFARARETPNDPREISLGNSVNVVLDKGHRGLVICGNGHLKQGHRPGNAREIIDKRHPKAFYLIDTNPCAAISGTAFSVINGSKDSYICLGTPESLTAVRPSPLIYRDKTYFRKIRLLHEALGQGPLDLTYWKYEYRGRYFEVPLPFNWPRGLMEAN
jgi:hypothetical protein